MIDEKAGVWQIAEALKRNGFSDLRVKKITTEKKSSKRCLTVKWCASNKDLAADVIVGEAKILRRAGESYRKPGKMVL